MSLVLVVRSGDLDPVQEHTSLTFHSALVPEGDLIRLSTNEDLPIAMMEL